MLSRPRPYANSPKPRAILVGKRCTLVAFPRSDLHGLMKHGTLKPSLQMSRTRKIEALVIIR